MCREPVGPSAKGAKGLIQWPSDKDLEGLSGAIRDLASLYSRGDGSTWSCILAVQNKRPSLQLRKRIEDLADRASKLYWKLPRAIGIEKQAKEGSVAAEACLKDLQKCYNGQAEIVSIKWERHDAILAPRAAKGETRRERAAQICLDWLRWSRDVHDPSLPLSLWLTGIGNLALAKKLDHLGSTDFFDKTLERRKEDRRKESDAHRQRKQRLKSSERKLVQGTRND